MSALAAWGGAPSGYSFNLLQKLTDEFYRLQVIPAIVETEDPSAAVDEDDEDAPKDILSPEEKQQLALKNDKIIRVPKSAEGIWTLEELVFTSPYVENLLCDLRTRLFEYLHEHKSVLDAEARATLACEEEAINTKLDRDLRKHTNRKGEVQVDW